MKIKVTSVKALDKYKIHISFNDEKDGVLDMSSHASKGVFKSWDENDNFNKVFVNEENGAITWPNEIDINTYNAYFIINNISPEVYFQSQKKYAEHL